MDSKAPLGGQRSAGAFAGAEAMPRRRAMLRSIMEARFARLQALLSEWGGQLPASDWRMRLVHKALYSTWADLRSLQEAAREAQG